MFDFLNLKKKSDKFDNSKEKYTLPGTQIPTKRASGKRNYTHLDIRSFENGVFKIIEHQIRQVFHLKMRLLHCFTESMHKLCMTLDNIKTSFKYLLNVLGAKDLNDHLRIIHHCNGSTEVNN